MNLPDIKKPKDPRFSCGPTKKPEGWSLKKINNKFLGRYHRSEDVKKFIEEQIFKIRKILNIPKDYKIFIMPGSCTGAMEAVIWSILGKRKVSAIIYDYWGKAWYDDMKKLNYKVDCRLALDGSMPSLKDIPTENDVIIVWTGTTTGISINKLDFLDTNREGLIISDVNSAVFIYDLPWSRIDVSVFSWQKALGSESQHGVVIMSPKAMNELKSKKVLPKIFDFKINDFSINTPSLLSVADLELCIDLYNESGGLLSNKKKCEENSSIINNWVDRNKYVERFVKRKKYQALSPFYLPFKQKFRYDDFFNFLSNNKIAYDIRNYRMCKPGIRIWTGPTIKKNDLIALTNWLDWCFNKFVNK